MSSLLILVPLICVMIINLPPRKIFSKLGFWVALVLSLSQIYSVMTLPLYRWNSSFEIISSNFKFNLLVDSLSLVMLVSISIVLLSALLVARELIRDEKKMLNFLSLLILLQAGMNAVCVITDIFSLYVFIEIISVISFILIAFNKDRDAFEAAFKYIVLSAVATMFMLASIALFLLIAGDTSFMSIKAGLADSQHSLIIMFGVGIFICGLFIKGGVMPFHGWLVDAYSSAPNSVSIMLAGIITKTVGIYTLIRLVSLVFGFDSAARNVLLALGALSIVGGALAALGQNDFKRMLSYSSISQVGYIIIGLGCGSLLGVAGAVFHLFNHSIFKSLLFVNSAAVESQAKTRDMDKICGLAEKMPLTATTSVIATLSAAGVPPFAGFWSKFLIILALWILGYHAYAIIAILASVLTLSYLLTMQRKIFLGKLTSELSNIREAGFGFGFASLILSFIIVGVGLVFPFIINSFLVPFWNFLGV